MTTTAIFSALLTLLAGIGVFLIACQMMSNNLEAVGSERLRKLFAKASGSRLMGVGIGTVGTAAIQSSGAITVMVIGFVNARIVSLTQAATIIYGANIGTTVTAQIVALGMFGGNSLSTSVIFSAFAGFGAFAVMFAKSDIYRKIGGILTGFGMLFIGLSLMSGSMEEFAAQDSVRSFLAGIDGALLLVLIGALFTAVIQSSSVMTSIALAMVVSGLISLNQGIFLTMGSNIGSCVVAIIAGMTGGSNARRTALIHLLFNCGGVAMFMIVGTAAGWLTGGAVNYGALLEKMFPSAPQTQLAMFHTIFNCATVLLMLPLTDGLVRLVTRLIPDKENESDAPHLHFIDENMLKTPPIAVRQIKAEIVNMAGIAMNNFQRSIGIISTMDFSEAEQFRKSEDELDYLYSSIVDFAVRLSEKSQLNHRDRLYVSTAFRTSRDIERIGDYSENILEYAEAMREKGIKFSQQSIDEVAALKEKIFNLYSEVTRAYTDIDYDALERAEDIEETVDRLTQKTEESHISRLTDGVSTSSDGAHFLSLSSDAERIADHLINIGRAIRKFS